MTDHEDELMIDTQEASLKMENGLRIRTIDTSYFEVRDFGSRKEVSSHLPIASGSTTRMNLEELKQELELSVPICDRSKEWGLDSLNFWYRGKHLNHIPNKNLEDIEEEGKQDPVP